MTLWVVVRLLILEVRGGLHLVVHRPVLGVR